MNDTMDKMVTPTTWAGAFIGGFGAITVTEWMAVGGFFIALAGFCVNVWHKRAIIRIARDELEIKRKQAGHK